MRVGRRQDSFPQACRSASPHDVRAEADRIAAIAFRLDVGPRPLFHGRLGYLLISLIGLSLNSKRSSLADVRLKIFSEMEADLEAQFLELLLLRVQTASFAKWCCRDTVLPFTNALY